MKQKQDGFSHLVLVAAIVFVIGLAGLSYFRISNNDDSTQKNVITTNKQQITAEKVTTTTDEKTTAQTVAEEPAKDVAVTVKTTPVTTKPVATPAQKRTISFTKGGGGQQDTVVHVSANLSENQQGTCTYTFSLNGTVRVEKTSSVSNSNQCVIDIPVSAFPKSATYSFGLTFISSDGLVSATQAAYDIEVM